MRHSIKPRDGLWIGYGFLSFAKNMDKSLSNNYGEKIYIKNKYKNCFKKSNSKNSRSN